MFKVFLIIILFLTAKFLYPDKPGKLGENKSVTAFPLVSSVKIDGILNEEVWQNPPTDNFIQRDPRQGEPATELTHVWVGYDEAAVYIGAKMFDSSPDSIVGLLSRRDYINESDWFKLYLDPYFDRRSGYFFGVNAAGSIMDGILFNDSWDDNSWNGIWEYAVGRFEGGWTVEMRIPFTQIRFRDSDDMKWGINFSRVIQRKNERLYFIMVPKNESGFVSHFATLEGLRNIKPKQRFEIMPYGVTRAHYLIHETDDPFYKGKQYNNSIGADIKMGLGTNLTLDATINPDFGQVEVDPAVVNLSVSETYFNEKRPFFIEGSNIFMFGYGGSNNNWGFNWGNPDLFYSRRIGRVPQGSVSSDSFIDMPGETRILGAGKLSGKLDGNISVGLINAVTERTFARDYNFGNVKLHEVEPLSNYTIIRSQKEFNSGRQGIGFMGTSVYRDLGNNHLSDILSRNSFAYGADGWVTLDEKETYVVTGYVSGSAVYGTNEYITRLQRSPLRYYQRPDAINYRIDSSRTSLTGYVGRVTLNKQKGNFYINTAIGAVSPGYEVNDAGFQWRSDQLNSHLVLGYRWFEPDGIFRRKEVYTSYMRSYNYDGDLNDVGFMLFSNFQFENYYGLNLQGHYSPESYNTRITRGGPLVRNPESASVRFNGYSDMRNKTVLYFYASFQFDNQDSYYRGTGIEVNWKPNSTVSFSFAPFYNYNNVFAQWVGRFEDQYSPTYGVRYVFARMEQRTVGGNLRLDWTFTPALSLQLFVQPLFSVGDYEEFKELAQSRTYHTNIYGSNDSEISFDGSEYTVDPDGSGPAPAFTFRNPDFNFKSLRGNVVLRWEFLPGSVFFLVWTHDKTNFNDPGDFSFGRDFGNLWRTGSNNVLLAKISYWLDI
jgi:hypothetical protein